MSVGFLSFFSICDIASFAFLAIPVTRFMIGFGRPIWRQAQHTSHVGGKVERKKKTCLLPGKIEKREREGSWKSTELEIYYPPSSVSVSFWFTFVPDDNKVFEKKSKGAPYQSKSKLAQQRFLLFSNRITWRNRAPYPKETHTTIWIDVVCQLRQESGMNGVLLVAARFNWLISRRYRATLPSLCMPPLEK